MDSPQGITGGDYWNKNPKINPVRDYELTDYGKKDIYGKWTSLTALRTIDGRLKTTYL